MWLGIDAEIAPYFKQLKKFLEESDENIAITEILPKEKQFHVAVDEAFVMLHLHRTILKTKKQKGRFIQFPHFEQIPVNGILKKKERLILVLGEAGAGKSTCIKKLSHSLVKEGFNADSKDKIRIPIILRASDISSRTQNSLVDICAAETQKLSKSSKPSFSSEDLIEGRLIIFIDALDEIEDEQTRISVLNLIEGFHKLNPNCLIVVTSREYAFVKQIDFLSQFETFRLSPINYRQAEQIITAIQKGKSLVIQESQEVLRRLEQVHGLVLNPLLVTVFAATSDFMRHDIPANITELFKKFTEMMLGRWDATKGLQQQYHAPLKDFILCKIAFEMHNEGLTIIDIDRFNILMKKELESRGHFPDFDQLREEILNRSGLFVRFGDNLQFRHLLLQEFFAGRGIPSHEYIKTAITNDWWRRAIVFYFGDNPSNSEALKMAINGLGSRSVKESFEGTLTIGLGLQACYLVELSDKFEIYTWVIESLAKAGCELLNEGQEPQNKFPLTAFLYYYLFSRDSVALSIIANRIEDLTRKLLADESQPARDIRMFWLIVGLIESGSIGEAEPLIKNFKPSDSRLLLGIHLGCFLIQHLRVATKSQCAIAKRICDRLSDHVSHLRIQLLEEVKSELLEIREGKVATIDPPPSTVAQ